MPVIDLRNYLEILENQRECAISFNRPDIPIGQPSLFNQVLIASF